MSADSERDRPFRVGDILAGKYRIERVLGEGGMGVVVAATHLQLEQTVAVKFVLPSMLESKTVVERFLREARAAVRLRSEHVAKVLDVGTLEMGAPYMVMEYLEGHDLGQILGERGPLPFAEAADYVVQACEAVAEAHALGIVHRDLKPQNLFVTTRVGGAPLVKVLDFGISKMTSEAASGLTQTQTTIGSPLYMAPEQMRSARDVDARADIWALGVVLYKLVSGEVPFEADTMPALCYKVVHDPPRPLLEVRADVPVGLAGIVMRCLEKDPDRRFADVGELAMALEAFAPMSAYAVAERARSISGGMRGSLPGITNPHQQARGTHPTQPSVPPVVPPPTQPIPTISSWGDTKGGASRRRAGAVLGILGTLVSIGAVGLIALRVSARLGIRPPADPPPIAAPVAATPVVTAPIATAPAPASPSSVPLAVTDAAPSGATPQPTHATPPSTALAPQRPPRKDPPPVVAPSKPQPKPSSPDDEIPSLR